MSSSATRTLTNERLKVFLGSIQLLLSIPLLQILCAGCFLGITAQIKIPLYFTPVPLMVQTCAVMLVGAFLGSQRGALAVCCYILQGLIGLPVWAGGASGVLYFFGPTGGYIVGYAIQAFLIGKYFERKETSYIETLALLLFSVFVQMGLGSLWLGYYVGFSRCLLLGFYPFILTEILKVFFVASWVRRLRSS